LAIIRAGLTPIFTDICIHQWVLTPEIVLKACEKLVIHAVLPVAAFGRPLEVERWDEFTKQTGIPVIIDAASAFGNQRVGATTSVVFSFHATKPLAIGEGGAVASADPRFIEDIRRRSNFGFDSGSVIKAGTNAKLSEFHAVVGLAALRRWPENVRRRRELAAYYQQTLKEQGSGGLLVETSDFCS
jgi:dTDP-4-amino-4,6-dideoxygalactose transaminase